MSQLAEPSPAARPAWRPRKSPLGTRVEAFGLRTLGRLAGRLHAWCGPLRTEPIAILTWHQLFDPPKGLKAPAQNVAPRRFEEQLAGLQQRGYRFWSLNRLIRAANEGERPPARTIAVTFDDGYESFATRAVPALERLSIPATVFVNTAYLGSDDPFPFDLWSQAHRDRLAASDYRPMRREACLQLAASPLVELGAHTHTHEDFRGRAPEFRADLERNLVELREQFGVERPPLAFPFGSRRQGYVSDELVAAARELGVSCTLANDGEGLTWGSSPFSWSRFNVFDWDDSATLAARIDGWFERLMNIARRTRQLLRGRIR